MVLHFKIETALWDEGVCGDGSARHYRGGGSHGGQRPGPSGAGSPGHRRRKDGAGGPRLRLPPVHEMPEDRGIQDAVARRRYPGQKTGLQALRRFNRSVVRLRAHGEHAFRVLKCPFGYRKTRYRGLARNGAQLTALFALVNFYLLRRKLCCLQTESVQRSGIRLEKGQKAAFLCLRGQKPGIFVVRWMPGLFFARSWGLFSASPEFP